MHSAFLAPQLRVVVVGALGYSAKLLSPQHLDEQLPRLVPSILQLYKKHSEHYALSQVHTHTHTHTCTHTHTHTHTHRHTHTTHTQHTQHTHTTTHTRTHTHTQTHTHTDTLLLLFMSQYAPNPFLQGMCNILEAAAEKNTPSLQGLLDTILVSLHTFVSGIITTSNKLPLLRHLD